MEKIYLSLDIRYCGVYCILYNSLCPSICQSICRSTRRPAPMKLQFFLPCVQAHSRKGFLSKLGNYLDQKQSRSPYSIVSCALFFFKWKKNLFRYSIFCYWIWKEFSCIIFSLIYSEMTLITEWVLASFAPEKKRQKKNQPDKFVLWWIWKIYLKYRKSTWLIV